VKLAQKLTSRASEMTGGPKEEENVGSTAGLDRSAIRPTPMWRSHIGEVGRAMLSGTLL
jgi:hypothetical protein